ncbi:MAG TPA: tetratricopeptide repeat protein, partial [Bryobacteraceae bacterium]|nr:tetratricopeptide repeat protein [Bryobacteraceae bacterium]
DYTTRNTFEHKLSGTHFAMIRRGTEFFQKRWQTGFDGGETNVEELRIDYVIGSGNHSRSYLHRTARGGFIELPLSWYAEKGGTWGMSPQFDSKHPLTRRFISWECMSCHNANPTAAAAPETGTPAFGATIAEGIDCQRCHGPGDAHVKMVSTPGARPDAIRRSILNPARLAPKQQLEVCLQCHLEASSTEIPALIRRVNRGPFSYVAGQPLTDFLLFFDHAPGKGYDDKFEIVGSSAYRLMKSQCFLKSEGAMTCNTCHNPHKIERGEAAARSMEAVCRQCHAATFTAAVTRGRHTAATDCVSCHMPKRRPQDVVHTVFTDHLIQRRPPAGDLLAEIPERHRQESEEYRGEVVPLLPKNLPTLPDGPLYLALAQIQMGNNLKNGARQLSDEIAKARPRALDFYLALAEAWQKLGQPDDAVAVYQQALRLKPDSPDAMLGLGRLWASQGPAQFPSAAGILDRALRIAPRNASLHYQRGLVSFGMGQTADAAARIRRAAELDPDLPGEWTRLGEVLAVSGQMEPAENALRSALRIDPYDASAWNWLGRVLMSKDAAPEAIFSLRRASDLRPGYAPHLYDLALGLFRGEKADEARTAVNETLRADPTFAEARVLLGGLYARQRQFTDAVREYREAIRTRPDLGQARLELATVLVAQGNFVGAVDELRVAATDRNPQVAQLAAQALSRLSSGR